MQNDERVANPEDELKDPTISISISLLAALITGGTFVLQIVQHVRGRRKDRATVVKYLHMADRALNRLDEAYRSLISIYDQFDVLDIPFSPVKGHFLADERAINELRRLRSNIFYGERDLQDSLTELVGVFDEEDNEYVRHLSNSLQEIFQRSFRSEQLHIEFLIQLGILIRFISEFLYRVGDQYEFRPASYRMRLINDTLEELESRLRR